MASSQPMVHALSFDIEDWFHIVEIEACGNPRDWPGFSSIVTDRTRQILDLLDEYKVKATFFVLGWVAEHHPGLVRRIADSGHELGTHSYWHRKVYELTPETFLEDLSRSVAVIEERAGVKVRGFRAPSFSIVRGTEWAFDVIRQAGLEYDASLFPGRRSHGGYPCLPGPQLIRNGDSKPLPELPMSVVRWGPFRLCTSGGGYFRLLPRWAIELGIRIERRQGRPTVVYLHPRDFAVDCPTVPMPLYRRFKCYVGQGSTEGKLRHLLANYPFTTCAGVLQAHGLLSAP